MHPQRYLGLLPVSAEMPLADQDANEESALDVGQVRLWRVSHFLGCFTVKKNVKHRSTPQSSGVITRYLSGSSPSLCVATPPRSRRCSWTIRRSQGGIGSSSTGRPT